MHTVCTCILGSRFQTCVNVKQKPLRQSYDEYTDVVRRRCSPLCTVAVVAVVVANTAALMVCFAAVVDA